MPDAKSRTTEKKEPSTAEHKSPEVLAEETLRDVRASPRARSIARAYLELLKKHNDMKALSKHLADELDKYRAKN